MFKYCALFGLLLKTLAQTTSDAYVKITSDSGQLAGAPGIYEFTVEVLSGVTIQTYMPSLLQNPDGLSICLQRSFNIYTSLTSCSYDSTLNMIQFTVPNLYQTGGWFSYNLGYFTNPPESMLLTGFLIQIFDQYGSLVSQSDPAALFVQIQPNFLTMQSLSVSSVQIAAQSTFLFQFTTTNPVPAQGQIQVTFPSNQIAVPTIAPQAQVSIDNGSTWRSVNSASITQNSINFVVPISIGSNVAVQLKILQLNNPNTMAVTQSFSLSTLDEELNIIDQVSTGLTIQCTVPAQLNITQVTISSRTVGATTSATFRLSLPMRYSAGGYIIITTPSTVTYNNNSIQCVLLVGFVNDLGQCTVLNSTQLKLFGAINQQQLTFSIASGIINPPNTQTTNNFLIQAFDPDGNLIANSALTPSFGYTPTPGSIQSATVIRSNFTVGQDTNLTISFKNQNTLQSGQLIQIQIPFTQFFISSQSILCYQKTASDSSFTAVACSQSQSGSNLTVMYSVSCVQSLGCLSGTQFSLLVTGLKNLGQISISTQSIQIYSLTSDELYLIDQVRSGLISQPSLVPGSLTQLGLQKLEGIVSSPTIIQVQATSLNVIPVDGQLVLTVQDQSFQPPTNGLISCFQSTLNFECTYSSYKSGYIQTITLSQLCGAGQICASLTSLNITITGLRNPKSTYPIQNLFTLQTQTSSQQQIDIGSLTTATGLQVQPANLQLANLTSPLDNTVIITGAKQTYQVQVGLTNGVEPILGLLVLSLPIEVSVTSSTCSAISQTTSQALTCTINGQNVTVTHSFSSTNFAAQTILISINNAANPQTTQPSSQAQIITYLRQSAQDKTLYTVETLSDAFLITSNTANLLSDAAFVREVTQVDSLTAVQFCFTTFNPMPSNSVVKVVFPSDQVILGSSIQSNATLVAIQGQQLIFQQLQSVQANTKICIRITGDVRNSASTKVSSTSVSIETQTNTGYLIDKITSGVFLTPYLSAGPFAYIAAKSTNATVGQITSLIIDLQAQATLASGTLVQILMPSSIFYYQSSVSCILQGINQGCLNTTTQTDQLGDYITSAFVVLETSFSSGTNFTITISNLLNKFDTSPRLSTNLNVIAQDQQGNGISQSTATISQTYQTNTVGSLTYTRSQLMVQAPTIFSLAINLQTRLPQDALLLIFISQSLVGSVQTPSVSVNGQVLASLITNNVSTHILSMQIPAQPDRKQLQVIIGGFTNRYSTDSTNGGISISTSVNSFEVDQIQLQLPGDILLPTSVNVGEISLSNPIVGQPTQLQISFNLTGFAQKDDIVSVICKSQFSFLQNDLTVTFQGQQLQSSSEKDQQGYISGFSFILSQSVSGVFSVTLDGLVNVDSARPIDINLLVSINSSLGASIAYGETDLKGIDMLTPANLVSSTFIRSTSLPMHSCSIQFNLTLPQVSSINQSVTLQTLIPITELLIDQISPCTIDVSLSCVITPFNSSYNSITISGLCSSGCTSNQTIEINILSGFQNPGSQFQAQLPYQLSLFNGIYIVAQRTGGISLMPSLQMNISLGDISLQTTSQTVALLTDLLVRVEIATAIPNGVTVQVALPDSVFYTTDSLRCKIQNSSQTCQNVQTNYDSYGQYYSIIKMTTVDVLNSGQILEMTIQNVQNKFNTAPLVHAVVTVSVQSLFGSAVCQSQKNLTTTYLPNTLASLSTIRTQKMVQQATTFDITAQLYTRLKAGSIMKVSIDKVLIGSIGTVSILVNGSPKVSSLTTSSEFYLFSFSVPTCDDIAVLSVQISGGTNRYSADDVDGGISFCTSVDGYIIDTSPTIPLSDSLTPISATLQSFNVSNTVVGQLTSLSCLLLITGFAKQNDVVQVQNLNTNFYLGQAPSLFYNYLPIQASYNQDQSGFLQGIVFFLPSDLNESTPIMINGLQNIDRAAPLNFQFQVTLVSSNGGLIAQGTSQNITQSVLQPTSLTVSSIIRNSGVPSQPCQIYFNLTIPQIKKIPQNIKLTVFIPITDLLPTSNTACIDTHGSQCQITSPSNSNYYQLTLINVCQVGCSAGQVIQIQVLSGFSNPSVSKVSSVPYQVQLADDSYPIAQSIGGIVLIPSLQTNAMMYGLNISQVELIAGGLTSLSLTFKVNSDVSGANSLMIQIPQNTLIKDSQMVQQCLLGSVQFTCLLNETYEETGAPIFVTKMLISGIQGKIQPNVSQTVTIKNLRNSDIPKNRSLNQNFGLALVDQYNFIYASTVFSEQDLGALKAAPITGLSVTRNKIQPAQSLVSYTFTFVSQNYIRYNSVIVIQIPKDQANLNGGIARCNEAQSGYTVQCQQLQSNESVQFLQVNQWCTEATKSALCQPNTSLKLNVILTNPSFFASSPSPIQIQTLSSSNMVTALSVQGAIVTPLLAGIVLGQVQLSRQKNILGTRDTMLIIVESIGASLFQETNFVLDLPDEIAYQLQSSMLICTLNNQTQVECTVSKSYTSTAVAQIQVKNVCTQSRICQIGKGFNISISNLKNPSTNKIPNYISYLVSLTQGQTQIARVNPSQTLPLLGAAQVFINTKTSATCLTFSTCPITFSFQLTNPLQKFDYLTLQSPLNFQTSICQVVSSQPLSCVIDNRSQFRVLANGFINNTMPIKVLVNAISMPQTTQSITSFLATSFETVNGTASIKDKSIGGNVTISASTFKTLNMQRSSNILSAVVNITISFTTLASIQQRQTLLINIPNQQALLKSESYCMSKSGSISCTSANQQIVITGLSDICPNLANGCQIQIINLQNPPSIYTGANSQQVNVQLQTDDKYKILEQQAALTPALVPSSLEILSATALPNNSSTASEITLLFTFALNSSGGQYMEISFEKTRFVPIYNQQMLIEVKVNEQLSSIVDFNVQSTGYYWAPIDYITFLLPANQQNQVFTVSISGLQNPNYWNNSFDQANITLTYLHSSLATIAKASYSFAVNMAPDTINPLTVYSESPFVSTQTFLDISLGVEKSVAYGGIINLQLPDTYSIDKNLNCSDLQSLEKVACQYVSATALVIPFNSVEPYTGFTIRVGPIKNPKKPQIGVFTITIEDSNGIYAQGKFNIQTSIQGSDCPGGCEQCTSEAECTSCDQGLVLRAGNCEQVCAAGEFVIQNNCYSCQTDCLACQTQSQCSVCPQNKVFLSGLCLEQCPLGYQLLSNSTCIPSPAGAIVVNCSSKAWQTYQQTTINDTGVQSQQFALSKAGINSTTDPSLYCKPVFPPLQCQVQNCIQCGLIGTYCEQCSQFRLDGVCIASCPIGYFGYQQECYKCNPTCKSCSGTANTCTSCSTGLLYSEKFATCTETCPIGTYRFNSSKTCFSCDGNCNTCSKDSRMCTSCVRNQENNLDLYLSKTECVESCPRTEKPDLRTHRCISQTVSRSSLIWSVPLCILVLIFSFVGPNLSKLFKERKASILNTFASAGLLSMFDFFNKLGLLTVLWSSDHLGVFAITGMSLLAASILGIYETHLVGIVGKPPMLKVISQLVGPHSTRLYLSNFLAFFKAEIASTQQPQLMSKNYEMCCLAQSAISLVQILNCIGVLILNNVHSVQFGLALNGLAFGTVGLVLHALILRNARAAVVMAK